MKRKAVAVLLLASLALTACGGTGENGSSSSGNQGQTVGRLEKMPEEAKQYIWKEEVLTLAGDTVNDVHRLLADSDYYYAIGSSYDPEADLSSYHCFRIDKALTRADKVALPKADEGLYAEYGNFCTDPEGEGVYAIQNVYVLNERPANDTTDPEEDDSSEETTEDKEFDEKRVAGSQMAAEEEEEWFEPYDYESRTCYLIHVSSEGETLTRTGIELQIGADGWEYGIDGVYCLEEGLLVAFSNHALQIYDKEDGSLIRTVREGENTEDEDFTWYELFVSADGHVYEVSWAADEDGHDGRMATEVNLTTGKREGKGSALPANAYGYLTSASGPGMYTFYDMENGILAGYHVGDKEKTKIMDGVDSDLFVQYLNSMIWLDETHFLSVYYDDDTGESVFSRLTKVDPADVKDKMILTLGVTWIGGDTRKKAVQFNRSNDTYRIRFVDYSQYVGEDGEWEEVTAKMNQDIISGNAPDMLMIDSDLPMQSYFSKGVFEDLNPYFDDDPEISRDDYYENVLDAMSSDGHLYRLSPSFNIMTYAVRKSDLKGVEGNLTLKDCERIIDENRADYQRVFGFTNRQDILSRAMSLCGEGFIDWEHQTCHFNSETFVELLDFIGRFPEEYDESMWDEAEYSNFRNRKSLFYYTFIYTFDKYGEMKYGIFDEEIDFTGFPYDGLKRYEAITYDMQYAMSASCPDKEAAWQFLRLFLLPDFQETISIAFPLRKDALQAQGKRATERAYYDRPDGTRDYFDRATYVGQEEVLLPELSSEDVEKVTELIERVDYTMYVDDKVKEIIEEEAAAFFAGQKSAREVADIIQNRVKMYVNEVS